VCSGGSCGGTPVVCNDTNVCTDDSCDAATGACKYVPNSSACDDGNKCTLEDRCSAGTCKGTPKSCDDGNECTNEYCYNGICFWGDVADGTPCDDESACTAGDSCQGGTCKGMPVLCLVPVCHDGGCDPGTGCWVKPVEGACEDGRACTANDTCGSNGGEWGCNPGASTCASPNPTCTGTGCQCCSLLGGCTTCNSLAADTCYATSKTSVECRCGTKPACSGLTPCCKAGGCVPKDIVTGKCPKS
jgi:hypothetical protein